MNFFKSVFSEDRDPPIQQSPPAATAASDVDDQPEEKYATAAPSSDNSSVADGRRGGLWGFGGLIKTLASKSETVIQTYRRDLEEFGSGLKKETAAIREAAARAVHDLPGSLEAGASVAQESLETVGQAIDEFGGSVWRGTSEIISHGKEAILSMEAEAADQYSSDPGAAASSSKRYTRFEAQVLAIQSDVNTFSEEPEDAEDFHKWRSEFNLAEKEEEIEFLCYENAALEGFLEKLVPAVVDYETFWRRYYYKVHKLKQAEDARANLVKRVIANEEEDLSWEVDDDEEVVEEENKEAIKVENLVENREVKVEKEEDSKEEESNALSKVVKPLEEPVGEKNAPFKSQFENLGSPAGKVDEEATLEAGKPEIAELTGEELSFKSEDNLVQEGKTETRGSCKEKDKDSDFSIISSQPSAQEEDDLGWDEIEDLGEHEDKNPSSSGGSSLRTYIRTRLNVAEEDEDLSWDIEDDDEPTKP